jgi:hypothetical protein
MSLHYEWSLSLRLRPDVPEAFLRELRYHLGLTAVAPQAPTLDWDGGVRVGSTARGGERRRAFAGCPSCRLAIRGLACSSRIKAAPGGRGEQPGQRDCVRVEGGVGRRVARPDVFSQRVGIPLSRIADALAGLPANRTPTAERRALSGQGSAARTCPRCG